MTDTTADQGGATPSNPEYLTTAEASQATGITKDSLDQYRALRKHGIVRGPDFVRAGGKVLYPREAIEQFIAARNERG